MTEHSKLPWGLQYRAILDGEGEIIAAGHVPDGDAMIKDYDLAAANAAFIVRACNSHDALVKALETLLEEAENFSVSGVYFSEECMGHKGPGLARQALALSSKDRQSEVDAQPASPGTSQPVTGEQQ